jgi:hypothetical protein
MKKVLSVYKELKDACWRVCSCNFPYLDEALSNGCGMRGSSSST